MKTQILSWNVITIRPREIGWTIGLIGASVILPSLLVHTPNNQWITGSLVNACLFLAAWRLPIGNALPVAIIPSSIALMRGLLPMAMAPLVPVIIVANILLIVVANLSRSRMLSGMIGASFIKFFILTAASLLFFQTASQPLMVMFQLPQLITALAGGFIALIIQKSISRNEIA